MCGGICFVLEFTSPPQVRNAILCMILGSHSQENYDQISVVPIYLTRAFGSWGPDYRL